MLIKHLTSPPEPGARVRIAPRALSLKHFNALALKHSTSLLTVIASKFMIAANPKWWQSSLLSAGFLQKLKYTKAFKDSYTMPL
jgi:hypothetical protein